MKYSVPRPLSLSRSNLPISRNHHPGARQHTEAQKFSSAREFRTRSTTLPFISNKILLVMLYHIKVSILNGLLFIVLCDDLIAGSGQQHDSRELRKAERVVTQYSYSVNHGTGAGPVQCTRASCHLQSYIISYHEKATLLMC